MTFNKYTYRRLEDGSEHGLWDDGDFPEHVDELATLFSTRRTDDVDRAREMFFTLIDSLREGQRQDLIDIVAKVLEKPVRTLCRDPKPFDMWFESIFITIARAGSKESIPFLTSMIFWKPDDIDWVLVREMAAEALAHIPDSQAISELIRIATDHTASRSPRRCAAVELKNIGTPEAKQAIKKLKADPVVADLV